MKTWVLTCLAIAVAAGSLWAQPTSPYPVGNFDRRPYFEEGFPPRPPEEFMEVGGRTIFSFNHPSHGKEPWVTDGTAAGTHLLLDICPGRCFSFLRPIAETPGLLYLAVESVDLFRQGTPEFTALWRTDGTRAGTFPLGPGEVLPVGYLPAPGLFFFSWAPPGVGRELWVTDGSPAGTRLLAELVPGREGGEPGQGARVGDRLVFPAFVAGAGRTLWVTDGTAAGTRALLAPGAGAGDPTGFRPLGEDLALFAAGGQFLSELWVTDGTAAGTRKLRDGHLNQPLVDYAENGERAVFRVEDLEMWASDGTPAGTYRLTPQGVAASGVVLHQGRFFFGAADAGRGRELWVSDDGARGSARRLTDLCPGPCSSGVTVEAPAGRRLIFTADDGTHGREPWSYDPATGETFLVGDFCPGECNAFRSGVRTVSTGPRAVFFAEEVYWSTNGAPGGLASLGVQIEAPVDIGTVGPLALLPRNGSFSDAWRLEVSDGTPAGTRPLTDFEPPDDFGSFPLGLTELGGEALFLARQDQVPGDETVRLLASRGTAGNTRTVVRFPRSSLHLSPVRRADDRVFFVDQYASSASELWISDGTAAGSLSLGPSPTLSQVPWGSFGSDLLAFVHGQGLNRIGGPPASYTVLTGERGLFDPVEEEYFVPLGGQVLFPTDNGFWATDGTAAGTVRLGPATPITNHIVNWRRLGDEVYWLEQWNGLWATDGTPGGTRQVCAEVGPIDNVWHRYIFAAGGRRIFSVERPGFEGLWTQIGAGDCERTVPGVAIDSRGLLPGVAAMFEGRLYFASDDGVHGSELWVSDGTLAGTRLLGDLRLGPGESRPHRFTAVGDRLYFTATDGEHGYELWSTDGTTAGTVRLGDIAPGPGSGYPSELTPVGDRLLFRADDGSRGAELWAVPLSAPDCTDAATLCLRNDRFRVQVHWRDQRTGTVGAGTALPFPGSDRTGMFWFFDAANVELIVKVLDGGPVNGFQWVFYGGLSDVEYWLTVTDTQSGTSRTYRNPPGEVCGRGDTAAFSGAAFSPPASPDDPVAAWAREPGSTAVERAERSRPIELAPGSLPLRPYPAAGTAGCQPGTTALCLLGGRFRVEVEWRDQRSGDTGVGTAIPGTDKSGFFWFFNAANVELVVKVLDGRPVNGKFWVFYGALSDVEYTIRVLDTESGFENEYVNPAGEICGRADTSAF